MIIEQSSNDFFEIYEKVKSDLINGSLVKDVRAKYNISEGRWLKFRKSLIEEGIIKSEKQRIADATYTYSKAGKWYVRKRINTTEVYFGCDYKTKSDGMMVVERLKRCGWDKSQLQSIREELGV